MEPTAKEREIAAQLVSDIGSNNEEAADVIANALADYRVEVQQAQREACAAICETFPFAHGSDECAAAIRGAGRDS